MSIIVPIDLTGLHATLPDVTKGPPGPEGPQGPQGERGPQGVPGRDGLAAVSAEGDFLPIVGGANGESGQVYSSQEGSYKVMGGICFCPIYVQFSSTGVINGPLVLKNLPVPIGRKWKVQIFGGLVTYFSNPRPDAPLFLVFRGGGGNSYAYIDGIWKAGENPKTFAYMTDDHVINNLSQIVGSFWYFVD